jgi:NAD(P)-dependent dehydrogenase (short-subunit alcohol dehydrogenase family)
MHPIEQLTEQERSMGKLEGKIALVTGGNSGIGLAAAKRFVTEGASVFITGRREPELAAAFKEIERNVTGIRGDVSNLGDLDRLFAQIERKNGKLDVVFANAGVAKTAPFGTITEEFYESIFNVNVKGLLFTVQKALPLLPDGASIILNASVSTSKGLARIDSITSRRSGLVPVANPKMAPSRFSEAASVKW